MKAVLKDHLAPEGSLSWECRGDDEALPCGAGRLLSVRAIFDRL
jgi:hypothetical protein